jgi:hypothetical protein
MDHALVFVNFVVKFSPIKNHEGHEAHEGLNTARPTSRMRASGPLLSLRN